MLTAQIERLGDRKAAAELSGGVMRMTRVVQQLMRVAELESLAIPPEATADLHAVAVDVAAMLAPLAVKSGKSIAVVGRARPLAVHGHAELLGHALRNLVENALAHTPQGTTVEIEVAAGDPREGGVPAFKVRDRGEGVPPENRDRIFQRFWRADRKRADGAGLGLAIVARIADLHGAEISVGDAPGGGAEFIIRLPASLPV